MMEINQIRDAIYTAIAQMVARPAYAVTPVSRNRLYIEVLVPGFPANKLQVKSKKTNLYVSGVDIAPNFPSFYTPTPFSIIFPMCGMTVDYVELVDGVLRIALDLEHEDAEKEYQINIPQPKNHPQYLTEDSIF
jgi:HSP20 family molecular chaperone IbpA